jgi:C-terminal processing protease CtpA/Prc
LLQVKKFSLMRLRLGSTLLNSRRELCEPFTPFLVRRFPVYRWTVVVAAVVGLAVLTWPASAQRADSTAQARPGASLGIGVEPTGNEPDQKGVTVMEVFPGGPAAKAGVRKGDVITRADDKQVEEVGALLKFLAAHRPGDKVTLHVQRDGKEKNVSVTLESRAESFAGEEQEQLQERGGKAAFLGVQTSPDAGQKGAIVTEVMPKSPAAKAGLRNGDVITKVDNQPIDSAAELVKAIRNAGVGKDVTITAQRGDKSVDMKARLEAAPGDMFGGPGPGLFPGGPGLRPGGQLLDLPDRMRQLQQQVEDLERRVRALEQQKGKGG